MHLIYITFPAKNEALDMANYLVEANLVACANLYENVTSIYKWQGKICHNGEVTLICKTADKLVDEVLLKAKQKHTYECPCIIAIKVGTADGDFLNWVESAL